MFLLPKKNSEDEHPPKKTIMKNANAALKYFRHLADPTMCGTLNFYELDITGAGPMDVPLPSRYPEGDIKQIKDPLLKSAVGAQYWYPSAEGQSVVTESVRFDPKEFIESLIYHGDIPCPEGKNEVEVYCLEWRAWPTSFDDALVNNNKLCAGVNWLEPPVKLFDQKPPICDFVLYMRGFAPMILHPGQKGDLPKIKFGTDAYEYNFTFPGDRHPGSGKGTFNRMLTASRDGDDPDNPVGEVTGANYRTPIPATMHQPKRAKAASSGQPVVAGPPPTAQNPLPVSPPPQRAPPGAPVVTGFWSETSSTPDAPSTPVAKTPPPSLPPFPGLQQNADGGEGGTGRTSSSAQSGQGNQGYNTGADHGGQTGLQNTDGFYAWNMPNPSTNQGTVQANADGQGDAVDEDSPWEHLE